MFASHHRLDNLVALVDYNKIQSLAPVSETLELEPFVDKWAAFGWEVRRVDGHQHAGMEAVLNDIPWTAGKPSCLILDTVKGKGVSFMEGNFRWHSKVPTDLELATALAELADPELIVTES